MFRVDLLHKVDLTRPPRWRGWHGRDIWFAYCNRPVERLMGDTAAGRSYCPVCAGLGMTAPNPPIQRGPSHG